jgi:nitroimidazol reductase NimA-like FMN-containing flavoprotein (pyridoxamine 5'-phosphate oxidase superfamily)
MIIRELSQPQCTALISENRLARLACARDHQPYLVPVFYAYEDECAYCFTMQGRKLDTMRANPNVALLVEEEGAARSWKSVVAEGRFEELPDRIGFKRERDRAWSLLSQHANWWEPGALKPVLPPLAGHASHVFFRIRVERMSGREALEG